MTLPMMRRRPAISPSPGMAVPATVSATARRNVRGGGVDCRSYARTRRGRRGAASSTYPAPFVLASTSLYARPGMETRSTIRAGSAQYAFGRLMCDLLCRSSESRRCSARIGFASRIVGSVVLPSVLPKRSVGYGEASPSPVYGARLLSGLRAQPSRGFKSRRLRHFT